MYLRKERETKASYLAKESFVDRMDFEIIVIREWGRSLVENLEEWREELHYKDTRLAQKDAFITQLYRAMGLQSLFNLILTIMVLQEMLCPRPCSSVG